VSKPFQNTICISDSDTVGVGGIFVPSGAWCGRLDVVQSGEGSGSASKILVAVDRFRYSSIQDFDTALFLLGRGSLNAPAITGSSLSGALELSSGNGPSVLWLNFFGDAEHSWINVAAEEATTGGARFMLCSADISIPGVPR